MSTIDSFNSETSPLSLPVTSTPPRDRGAQEILEARAIVEDLFVHRSLLYWLDLIATLAIAYPAAMVFLNADWFTSVQLISFLIAGFAIFRAGSYVHEIAHFRQGELTGFTVGWNLLCGIPFIMPSHFYTNHIDHHNSHHYGTVKDGEYLAFGTEPAREIFWFMAQIPIFPALVATRLLLSPLTLVHPKVRTFVLERMSSYVFNFRHRLAIPKHAPRRAWAALELACSFRLAIMFAVIGMGLYPWTRLVQLYCIAMFTLFLNYLRNLAAHRYQNTGGRMSHAEQLSDSVNLNGGWVMELFFPLGLRYHALHHLFPGLPFHNLGKAHLRLMKGLPPGALYRKTIAPGYWTAVRDLWTRAPRDFEHSVAA